MLTTHSTVVTTNPERFIKQLASHLGRKLEVSRADDATVIEFDGGSCELRSAGTALEMQASAGSSEVLDRVQRVVGSHLERFGTREGLVVEWVGGHDSEVRAQS